MPERADLFEAEESARSLARLLKERLPAGWGFFLCLASLGEDGFMTYSSSVERYCAGSIMLQLLEIWKKDPELWNNVSKEFLKARERKESCG